MSEAPMLDKLQHEWRRLRRAFAQIDAQTVVVLITSIAFVFVQYMLGEGTVYDALMSGALPEAWHEFGGWVWWFGLQALLGFVLPVAVLLWGFGRSFKEAGLGLGDWKFATLIAVAYIPLAAIGTWILSNDAAFQYTYPHYSEAAHNWGLFLAYQLALILYWLGWEYLWRGYMIFGTAHTLGKYAIFVQMLPFTALHIDKPPAEAFLSIFGALVLGALVWRCRAFWIAIPIHAAQMLLLDIWCTLRLRTGVEGIGPGALLEALGF